MVGADHTGEGIKEKLKFKITTMEKGLLKKMYKKNVLIIDGEIIDDIIILALF
jgi:hypothetical protein